MERKQPIIEGMNIREAFYREQIWFYNITTLTDETGRGLNYVASVLRTYSVSTEKNLEIVLKFFPWSKQKTSIIFQIQSHPFITPDCIFDKAEKVLRKPLVILNPVYYINIPKQLGTVKRSGIDFHIEDYEQVAKKAIGNQLPFKIPAVRMLQFQKTSFHSVGTSETYFANR